MKHFRLATSILLCGALLFGRPASADIEIPPIGTIDFYGLRSLSVSEARKHLPFKEGDVPSEASMSPSHEGIARALHVEQVEFAFVCCTSEGRTQIYVGVRESPGGEFIYRAAPTGKVRLPADMMTANDRFMEALYEAVRTGQAGEDDSQGHSLMTFAPALAQQEIYLAFAKDHRPLLLDVLENSSDARHRAVAAQVLSYYPDKKAIVKPLTRATSDPDSSVRNNAVRALVVIASYSIAHTELRIRIDAAPFVHMLNSIVWSDRNKGLWILDSLTASRDPKLLKRLRKEAGTSLVEMCAWKGWGHAFPACQILRRVMGMADDGDPLSREATLERARFMHQGVLAPMERNPPGLMPSSRNR